jgi:LmbE family N-acetylglucosaminyl deacetylase
MTPERLSTIRLEEQRQAARVLGVQAVDFLGFRDCEVENTRATRLAVTAAIRATGRISFSFKIPTH